jgi:glycosyltransferase involved in cell wall biosynthesis
VAHGGDPLRLTILAGLHRRAQLVYLRVAAVTPDLRTPTPSRALRLAYSKVDAFVAVSGPLAEELIAVFGVEPRKVRVIPNGRLPPPSLDPPRRELLRTGLGVRPEEVLVAWVGRFVPEKDPMAAIRLAGRLSTVAPSARVVMVGGGPLAPEVRAAAAGIGNIILAGEREDAPAVIAAADVFVSTSLTEGVPGVFVEALLAGVPVVAHDMVGVRDVLSETTGALVPPGDEAELAAAVATLATDPSKRTAASAAARTAGQPFHIAPVARAYDALYRELFQR